MRHAYKIAHGLANTKANTNYLAEHHAIAFHAPKDVPKYSPVVTNVQVFVARSVLMGTVRFALTSEKTKSICWK